jgi:Uncharacterized protein conserved in bacteria (DUF2255)
MAMWTAGRNARGIAVTFGEAADKAHAAIDAAYHAKYDRYGSATVGHVVGHDATTVTVRLAPRSDED